MVITTRPQLSFLPPTAVNFTLTITSASNGDTSLLIHKVEDLWMSELLRRRGYDAEESARLIARSENAASCTFHTSCAGLSPPWSVAAGCNCPLRHNHVSLPRSRVGLPQTLFHLVGMQSPGVAQ